MDKLFLSAKGVRQANVSTETIRQILIPLPPLPIQEEIAHRLEMERAEMEMLKGLIARKEGKIKEKLAGMWTG